MHFSLPLSETSKTGFVTPRLQLYISNVGPDLNLNCLLHPDSVFLKEFFEKVNFEKVSRQQQKHEKLPIMQIFNVEKSMELFPKNVTQSAAGKTEITKKFVLNRDPSTSLFYSV